MTAVAVPRLIEQFERGLDAPICLTWELTYACNLACVHCLSSSGRRDPGELSPAEARGIVDAMVDLKVFYVNIGGGEPMLRPDFFDLVSYAVDRKVGVKFSTNGTRISAAAAHRLAATGSVDVQVSVDGATADVCDAVRGEGAFDAAMAALNNLSEAGVSGVKLSVVLTRHNAGQLDDFEALAYRFPQLSLILGSWGGTMCLQEMMPELPAAMLNVYYDTASPVDAFDVGIMLGTVTKVVRSRKVLFGSASPLLPRDLGAFRQAGVAREVLFGVLGNNLSLLLGLKR